MLVFLEDLNLCDQPIYGDPDKPTLVEVLRQLAEWRSFFDSDKRVNRELLDCSFGSAISTPLSSLGNETPNLATHPLPESNTHSLDRMLRHFWYYFIWSLSLVK